METIKDWLKALGSLALLMLGLAWCGIQIIDLPYQLTTMTRPGEDPYQYRRASRSEMERVAKVVDSAAGSLEVLADEIERRPECWTEIEVRPLECENVFNPSEEWTRSDAGSILLGTLAEIGREMPEIEYTEDGRWKMIRISSNACG